MIHDTGASPLRPIDPGLNRDRVDSLSRRVNQTTEVVTKHPEYQESVVGSLSSGVGMVLNLIFDNVQNAGPVVALWDLAIFVDDVNLRNLLFPAHASSLVNLNQWQLIGPAPSLYTADGTGTLMPTTRHTFSLGIRNLSAGTVSLIIQTNSRYIFNRG